MKYITLLAMMIWWATAAAQMLPPNGSKLTVSALDAIIPDCPGQLYDLSGATITAETEIKFEYYGDTLVRCVAGPCAHWMRIAGDSIMSLGYDTRRDNIRYTKGLLYLLPAQNDESADSLHYRMFMTVDHDNMITHSYRTYSDCGFVLPSGDSISSTYCVLTETVDSMGKVCHRRWYAEGAVWPVVESATVYTDDTETSSLYICKPDDLPHARMAAKGTTTHRPTDIYGMLAAIHTDGQSPSPPMGSGDMPHHSITMTTDGITVSGADTDNAIVRLFDSAGRQWHESPLPVTISTSHLPKGVYMLSITSRSGTATTKIIIN